MNAMNMYTRKLNVTNTKLLQLIIQWMNAEVVFQATTWSLTWALVKPFFCGHMNVHRTQWTVSTAHLDGSMSFWRQADRMSANNMKSENTYLSRLPCMWDDSIMVLSILQLFYFLWNDIDVTNTSEYSSIWKCTKVKWTHQCLDLTLTLIFLQSVSTTVSFISTIEQLDFYPGKMEC